MLLAASRVPAAAAVQVVPSVRRGGTARGACWLCAVALSAATGGCGEAPGSPRETTPPPPQSYARPAYGHLAETGLFADPSALRIANDAVAFEPTFWLWSDGANKRRWLRLPPGTRIDTTDMDHWIFPIGSKLWKEFSLGGVLLETRLIERYGEGPEDYWMGAFVWNAGQTEAVLAPDGQMNIGGTRHDAPDTQQCGACHGGEPGRVLGFSALQLSRPPNSSRVGPTLSDLIRQELLTNPPTSGRQGPVSAPRTGATAALGYLHANCGHCHNRNGVAWPDTQMVLRLGMAEPDLVQSEVYRSLVGRDLQFWGNGVITKRVVAGNPSASAVVARMSVRGNADQMPPLATEEPDREGLAQIESWISSLAP